MFITFVLIQQRLANNISVCRERKKKYKFLKNHTHSQTKIAHGRSTSLYGCNEIDRHADKSTEKRSLSSRTDRRSRRRLRSTANKSLKSIKYPLPSSTDLHATQPRFTTQWSFPSSFCRELHQGRLAVPFVRRDICEHN